MHHIQQMLQTHPQQSQVDMQALIRCIQECGDCAQSCSICADACLGEQNVQMLIRCIRLNQDCADVCEATGRLLSRQTGVEWSLLRSQLQACAIACQVCGAECERHAQHHEHCRVCAESCRRCEEACKQLLSVIPQGSAQRVAM